MTDIIRDLETLRSRVRAWKRAGETVAVVPTMGALHFGHLSLVEAAKTGADRVIVTIFVNPKQFNNPDDLAKYPRTEEADAKLLAPLGIDVIFAPAAAAVYPVGFATTVSVAGVSQGLCGADRPGHFDGVATIVCKLFMMTGAELAYFGEKDFQQLMVVRQMVRDLAIAVDVIGCATVRGPDGLALSSRNKHLAADDLKIAPQLYARMCKASNQLRRGVDVAEVLAEVRADLLQDGFSAVDYLELRRASDLQPMPVCDSPARLLAAAWLGGVRLIDNIAV